MSYITLYFYIFVFFYKLFMFDGSPIRLCKPWDIASCWVWLGLWLEMTNDGDKLKR